MDYFLNFLGSKDHLYYVTSSYLIVFFLLSLIFLLTNYRVKRLEKKLKNKLKK